MEELGGNIVGIIIVVLTLAFIFFIFWLINTIYNKLVNKLYDKVDDAVERGAALFANRKGPKIIRLADKYADQSQQNRQNRIGMRR